MDENPFEIEIAALRLGAVAADSDEVIMIDVRNPPTASTSSAVTGDFRDVRRDTRFYDDDYFYNPGGGGGFNSVGWSASGLEGGQPYQVAVTWAGGDNRATDAPFTITAGGQTWHVAVDQNPSPNDFEEDGTYWEVLGTFVLPTDATSLRIELADNADGYVLADAVRPVRQAGRGVLLAQGRSARLDRELQPCPALGDPGALRRARREGPDHVRPDDRWLVDLHRHPGNPPGHV